jgi:hypothetical protein
VFRNGVYDPRRKTGHGEKTGHSRVFEKAVGKLTRIDADKRQR